MITAMQLHGFTLEQAECYGKPHFGAHYTSRDRLDAYKRDENVCSICMREAYNVHHQPDRSTFTLRSENGIWRLRPALLTLCGSGTAGCHGLVEANRIRITWEWDAPEFEDMWWDGELLFRYGAHNPALYGFGKWIVWEGGRRHERRKHVLC